jgi:deazaflavin-dependent oxidoreductase (nitroreductase family)
MSDYNKQIIEDFRANKGKTSMGNMNLLLMTIRGAKTGKETTVPVAYSKDGDTYIVAASKGGSPTNPDWYYNLIAHPEIIVEVGDEKFKARATNITGEERDRLYDQHAAQYPTFNDYKTKTTRIIPVFALERI